MLGQVTPANELPGVVHGVVLRYRGQPSPRDAKDTEVPLPIMEAVGANDGRAPLGMLDVRFNELAEVAGALEALRLAQLRAYAGEAGILATVSMALCVAHQRTPSS
jgi:hypothetical protein